MSRSDPTGLDRPILSIVIPVFNEGPGLQGAIERISAVLDQLDLRSEVILVDDGSSDDTWAVIEQLAGARDRLRGIRLTRNFGKESALCAGLESAQGQAIITMDADLQHPPELVPEMVGRWQAGGVDVVEAVKADRGQEDLARRWGARAFYTILGRLSGHDFDGATDFKLMDWEVVETWRRMGERNVFFRGMIAWRGGRVHRIPFSVPERETGTSRWRFFHLVRLALTAVTAFSALPLHLITMLGLAFLVFAALLGTQTVYRYLAGTAVSGFATVILLLLIIGSALMIALGIIGEYISRIYLEVKGRPRYAIGERIDGPRPRGNPEAPGS